MWLTAALALSVSARIDPILMRAPLQGASVGVCVFDEAGNVVYHRNADQRLTPASNQKILSVAYALAVLGPDFRPVTRFWATTDGIVVDAPGDPSLTSGRLAEIGHQLPSAAIVRVRGGFNPGWPPSWEWDDLPHRYAPAIHAFSCDGGAFELFVANGQAVPLPPALANVHVRRGATTGEPEFRYNPATGIGYLDGALPRARTSVGRFAQPDPPAVATLWLKPGATYVNHTGGLPSFPPTVVHTGPPLSELAKDCLEPSDNAYAEHLLLLAASKEGPLPLGREYEVARQRMQTFYQGAMGLTNRDFSPYDGSGMSRHNQATARTLARVLLWSRRQSWGPVFVTALAESGEGTLANRLQSVRFTGKTGTLNAVSSLSGYLERPGGKVWTLSLVVNQYVASASEIRGIQDDVVRELAEVEEPTAIRVVSQDALATSAQ
jgi:serine-type D-Ala-D-Ala carboxypeptidase/endopeptidase (penicillin-binding protein 4)